MKGNNQRQGGWIASFVIVGAVLVLGLVGGVYYLKNRTQAATVTPEPTAKQDSSKDKSTDKSDDKKQSSESAQSGENSTNSQADEQNKDEATLPAGGQSSANDTADAPAALPQTGPVDTMVTATLVTLLGFAAATYVQSRRALQ